MTTFTTFSDTAAQLLHARTADLMAPVIAELCPDYELRTIGIHRDPITGEVILKLHLRPLGSGRETADPDNPGPPRLR